MTKRWRFLLLTAPLAAVAAGTFWWHRSTPDWNEANLPWHGPDTLRDAYWLLAADPKRPASLGYSAAQQKSDDLARRRSREPYVALRERIDKMRSRGATLDEVVAYRNAQLPGVEASAHQISHDLSSLTLAQRKMFFSRAVRWAGVWLLTDVDLARHVGLSEAQREEFDRSADRFRRYYLDEQHAEQRDEAVDEGAPPAALLALDETYRFNARVAEVGLDGRDSGVRREYDRLDERSSYTPERTLPRWIDALRYDLLVRRVVSFRHAEEARLLASLSPAQRTRWDAMVR